MTPQVETLAAATAAVNALARVLGGDGKKDRGLMPRVVYGERHIQNCNRGLYLYPGSHATGGALCSERCVAAREALGLAGRFLDLLMEDLLTADLEALADAPEQLRLLEAV